MAEGKEGRS